MNEIERRARAIVLTAWLPEPLGFAGCLLFARDGDNVPEVRARTDALRAAQSTPIVAIDQEGGRVARLRSGVESLPSMMALGAVCDEALTIAAGEAVAHDLRRAGVTVDFAPVLDLALEPENIVIGTRAFGSDPHTVARLGRAFARGLRNGGITPVYKHFPGHGSTALDSHVELPRVRAELAALRTRDLLPFAELAHDDGVAMMSAHVVVDALDDRLPASLSRPVLHGLLRSELGFDGVVFSDCLQMNAVAAIGTEDAAVLALAAGADCLIVSHDAALSSACAARIADAVASEEVPVERLNEAFERVMRLRRSGSQPIGLDTPAPHPGIGREIARRAVTRIRGRAHADPTSQVISFEGAAYDGVGDRAQTVSLDAFAPATTTVRLPFDPSESEVERVLGHVSSDRGTVVLARRAHLYPAQVRAIGAIVARDPAALVVSAREPFDIPTFGRAANVLATYGDEAVSLAGLADVLFGGVTPSGTLPVALR